MKPKILDEWTLSRVQAPERAYKKFFFCKKNTNFNLSLVDQQPFRYTRSHSRPFGESNEDTLAPEFRQMLEEQKKKFTDYVERPSKYMPEPSEPAILSRQTKYFKNET